MTTAKTYVVTYKSAFPAKVHRRAQDEQGLLRSKRAQQGSRGENTTERSASSQTGYTMSNSPGFSITVAYLHVSPSTEYRDRQNLQPELMLDLPEIAYQSQGLEAGDRLFP